METKTCECSKWSQGVCLFRALWESSDIFNQFYSAAFYHSTSSFVSSLPIKVEDLRVWWWTLTEKSCDPIRLHRLKHRQPVVTAPSRKIVFHYSDHKLNLSKWKHEGKNYPWWWSQSRCPSSCVGCYRLEVCSPTAGPSLDICLHSNENKQDFLLCWRSCSKQSFWPF